VKSGFGASRRPQPLTLNPKPKIGLFYFGKKRTFLNWLDKRKEFS